MRPQHFKWDHQKKRNRLSVGPRNSDLERLRFEFFPLRRGEAREIRLRNEELLVNLLSGEVSLEAVSPGKEIFRVTLGPRKNIFSSKSHAFYAGPKSTIIFRAKKLSEVIFIRTNCAKVSSSFVIPPRDILVKKVGKSTYSRKVHHILKEQDKANVLIAGETFNEPGKWSSYPPHKHDQDHLPKESKMEELYFFRLYPENKFGLIRVYGKRGGKILDRVFAVGHNDLVVIPFGFHPVSALPDTKLYYFWALAGQKRQLRFQNDPAFS